MEISIISKTMRWSSRRRLTLGTRPAAGLKTDHTSNFLTSSSTLSLTGHEGTTADVADDTIVLEDETEAQRIYVLQSSNAPYQPLARVSYLTYATAA